MSHWLFFSGWIKSLLKLWLPYLYAKIFWFAMKEKIVSGKEKNVLVNILFLLKASTVVLVAFVTF